jgi:hypothetical protein
MAGDEDDGHVNVSFREIALEFETAASPQPHIQYEAGRTVRASGLQVFGQRRKNLDLEPDRTHQVVERSSD